MKAARSEIPVVNLPAALRQPNWQGTKGEGSCVNATIVSLLRWQNRPATAAWWRQTHGNGETRTSLARQLDAAGIPYATGSDEAFLEWAISTCRGCGIAVMGGRHFVALVYLDARYAAILDSNDTRRIIFVDREALIAEFRHSGRWATAILYSPAPPLPIWTYSQR